MSTGPLQLTYKGDFSKTVHWLKKRRQLYFLRNLNKYGAMGVSALSAATPVDTGETSRSWGYTIERDSSTSVKIVWTNTNVNNGVNVAVVLQYGHGTGTGGYVQGIDYINPAMRPVFEQIAKAAWEEVVSE